MFQKLFQWIFEPLNKISQGTSEVREGLISQDKLILEQRVTKNKKIPTHTVSIYCPTCNKAFNYTFNMGIVHNAKVNEEISINTQCPSCGKNFITSILKQADTWTCDYCSRRFDTKEAEEEHEKSCPMNKK